MKAYRTEIRFADELSVATTRRRGITLIEILVVISIIGILAALLISAVQAGRESARRMRCSGNLRQMGIGIDSHVSIYGIYPRGSNQWTYSYSLHSSLLPFLDNVTLYNAMNFTQYSLISDGNGQSNQTCASVGMSIFACPSDRAAGGDHRNIRTMRTNYAGSAGYGSQVYGFNGIFSDQPREGTSPPEVTDGLSQTLGMSEWIVGPLDHPDNNPSWALFNVEDLTAPAEFAEFVSTCRDLNPSIAALGPPLDRNWIIGEYGSTLMNNVLGPNQHNCLNGHGFTQGSFTANSFHPAGVNSLFLDGHVATVTKQIDLLLWRGLSTRAGREILPSGY